MSEYAQHGETRDEAILNAYHSGGYTQKQIGEFFGIRYSLVSRIIAKNQKAINYGAYCKVQDERHEPDGFLMARVFNKLTRLIIGKSYF